MKDRADFARNGIARGRSVIVQVCARGVLCVAENRSTNLHKISEIYDRIGFAAVGRYSEFENLRIAGIRYADLRGFSYDRRDVTARGLANQYTQLLGAVFSSGVDKPYEVELVVAEVGTQSADDQLFKISFDGSVTEERGFAVVGGAAESISAVVREGFDPEASLTGALHLAVDALGEQVATADLEVALLDRTREQQRKFVRLTDVADRLAR